MSFPLSAMQKGMEFEFYLDVFNSVCDSENEFERSEDKLVRIFIMYVGHLSVKYM